MSTKISARAIGNPEFINVKPYNPLISECEIKVFYIGQNRNRSYISKEVATEMANSLPGNPIVGWYKESKGDFADHGELITIDDEGVHFSCMTKPYGFVAPDAPVWFQKFEEEDEFGNLVVREYLMTKGLLWTGQFKEAAQILEDNGKPHSMEIDEETLDGHWSLDNLSNIEFFIINDAIISKLCVLGDDVEPCFEGSSVTAPEISSSFTKVDNEFRQTLFTMMNELKEILKEGGKQQMFEENNEVVVEEVEATENVIEDTKDEAVETEEVVEENNVEVVEENNEVVEEEVTKSATEEVVEEVAVTEEASAEYSLLEQKYNELQTNYADLESKYNELLEFKLGIEKAEKEELINSFYMLDEEDKQDVKANIDKYSKDDIEAKLSVICVRNKVNFDSDDKAKNQNNVEEENSPVTTFNVIDNDSSVPAWISACINTQNSKNK